MINQKHQTLTLITDFDSHDRANDNIYNSFVHFGQSKVNVRKRVATYGQFRSPLTHIIDGGLHGRWKTRDIFIYRFWQQAITNRHAAPGEIMQKRMQRRTRRRKQHGHIGSAQSALSDQLYWIRSQFTAEARQLYSDVKPNPMVNIFTKSSTITSPWTQRCLT